MLSMKRRGCFFLFCLCLLLVVSGCEKKQEIALADGVFLKVSVTVKGDAVKTYEMYTLNIEISRDGTSRMYADNFNRWMSTEPCPEDVTKLSADEVAQIEAMIDEIDLYHMRNQIGNRDLKEGEYKEITLYTTEGAHSAGGMNPSNPEFLKLYDYMDDLFREREYLYRTTIAELQLKGREFEQGKGIYITDSVEQELVAKEEINDVYVTYGMEHARYPAEATLTDGISEDTIYYVTLLVNDAAAQTMQGETVGCTPENRMYYKVYENQAYVFTFGMERQSTSNEIYIYETNDAEEAVELAARMRQSVY